MKFIWPCVVCCLLLLSCKEVSFRVPQPRGVTPLEEIPPSLQGQYLSYNQASGEASDTLIIEALGYHFKDENDNDWLGQGRLGDSLIVKLYQDIYFINFKIEDQWVLRLIRKKHSKAIEFLSIEINDDTKRKELLRKLSKRFEVLEVRKGDDTFYQIDPSPRQLMKLIDDGFFTAQELNKIN